VALLDEAVEALRAGGDGAEPEARVRFDVEVDAYLPADYIPFEAAKIDVHRRLAGARDAGELRALRDELRDRFGPPPDPVANLLELGQARVELGRLGAHAVEFRSGRLSITPLDLDAAAVGRLRERVPEAIFESRTKTLGLRVDDDAHARLRAVQDLTVAVSAALAPAAEEAATATL
jgi:transcription-repair coupling factor (superfamily II helicase)